MYMHIVGRNDDELIRSRDRWKLNIVFSDSCTMYLLTKASSRYVVPCTPVLSGLCSQSPQSRLAFSLSSFSTDLVPYNFDLKIQLTIISRLLYNLFCILCLGRMFGVLSCLALVQFFTALFRYFSHALLYSCKSRHTQHLS